MIIITESFNTKTICNGVVPLLLSPEKFACRDITYFGDTTPLCICCYSSSGRAVAL